MNIDAMLRGLAVNRLHTEPNVTPQTVGQHSANMCALLLKIYSPAKPPANLLIACITHDMPEESIGDVPAPVKWGNPQIKHELEKLETKWYEENQVHNPDFILDPEQANLLKIIDSLELFWYCVGEVNRGNKYAVEIIRRLTDHIHFLYRTKPVDSQIKKNLEELLP